MPEIGTSGSMSGDGKRGVAERPKLPRPSSTLPTRTLRGVRAYVACWVKADVAEGQEHQAATLVRRRNSSRPYLRDRDGQTLAYVYFEEEPGRRSAAKLLTRDEARRIAANVRETSWSC